MFQPADVVMALPFLEAAVTSGEVCVPFWVAGAVGVGFSSLGGFVLMQFKANQEKDKRTDQALLDSQAQLIKAQERLYDVLRDAARGKGQSA